MLVRATARRTPALALFALGIAWLHSPEARAAPPVVDATSAPMRVVMSAVGPFQHAVIGSSMTRDDGAILSQASVTAIGLPAGALVKEARLFWMGSRATPSKKIALVRPSDGTTFNGRARDADCAVLNDFESFDVGGRNYYQCSVDVTLFARGQALNGVWTAKADGEVLFQSGDPWGGLNAGGFALVLFFIDPADMRVRTVRVAAGLLAQDGNASDKQLRNDVLEMPALEIGQGGARVSFVTLEGDAQLSDFERVDLCRGKCDEIGVNSNGSEPVVPTASLQADLFAENGVLFREQVQTRFGTSPTSTDAFDLRTVDATALFDSTDPAENSFAPAAQRLHLALSVGEDAVFHSLAIVEVIEQDTDVDGLSDTDERARNTNPALADSDRDGIEDGVEVRGGDPANPGDPLNRVTDPLSADTDGDRACDGDVVVGACIVGEDLNVNGLFDDGELDPKNVDTDGDGVSDGDELDPPVIPSDGGVDSDGDGILDAIEVGGADHSAAGNADTDGDGLCDGVIDVAGVCIGVSDGVPVGEDRNGNGVVDDGETDPTNADSDGDGILDGVEVNAQYGAPLDPNDADTDDDGAPDGAEDVNHDGALDANESDPTSAASCISVEAGCRAGGGATSPQDLRIIAGSAVFSGCSIATTADGSVAGFALSLLLIRVRRRRAR